MRLPCLGSRVCSSRATHRCHQMPMPVGYREHPFPHQDRDLIEAVWTYLARENGEHRVLPDGRCDLILRFHLESDRTIGPIEPLIAGPSKRHHVVPLARGLGFVGVRLRPGMGKMVLGIDLPPIADRVCADIEAIRLVPALSQLRAPTRSVEELIDRLTKFVADRRASPRAEGTSVRSLALIEAIHSGGGRLSVVDLARMHEVDARTVRRDIKIATGLTPKELSMVVQFHRALRLLRDAQLDPVSAAAEAGYSDQAHMTRAFRTLGGFTPADLPDVPLAL